MIFSVLQRLIFSASSKIFVNLITAISVIVVVTSDGDEGRQMGVRQSASPILIDQKEKYGQNHF